MKLVLKKFFYDLEKMYNFVFEGKDINFGNCNCEEFDNCNCHWNNFKNESVGGFIEFDGNFEFATLKIDKKGCSFWEYKKFVKS